MQLSKGISSQEITEAIEEMLLSCSAQGLPDGTRKEGGKAVIKVHFFTLENGQSVISRSFNKGNARKALYSGVSIDSSQISYAKMYLKL